MKKILSTLFIGLSITALVSVGGCKKGQGLNIFTIQDDKNFGLQVEAEIAANPAQYPLLSRTTYASQYAYLEGIKQKILNSGKLNHVDDFEWKLYIVKDDATLNAFCTPGGYIYVYTGLIKYLDNASSLAGVLGHEMAHADQRHSTQALTEAYGIEVLLSVLGGDSSSLASIAAGLTTLAFSRSHENDADAHSVIYLCPTEYRADGAADFFQKIVDEGSPQPPAFLSTHPDPGNRIEKMRTKEDELACNNTPSQQVEITEYQAFKNSLP